MILPGRWPSKLTKLPIGWNSQLARAKAKERGNPNRRHLRFDGALFPDLNEKLDVADPLFAARDELWISLPRR